MPILGFTWYSLTDQIDWDTCLREDNGHVNPLACTTWTGRSGRSAGPISSWSSSGATSCPPESLCLHHIEPEEFDTPGEELLTWGGED